MIDNTLDIRPNASILGAFSRLNYKPWYAIGEFVDNATASFFSNESTMKFYKINSITVEIDYNPITKVLTIRDDAYGMELDNFKRAIILDSKPENQGGRNEFCMGLKTAASWFGNVWTVETTMLNSNNKYNATVDINELRSSNSNNIKIETSSCEKMEHGTIITISDVTKPIDASRTQAKIKSLLQSMYRRDINSGKVIIKFRGEPLVFKPYDILFEAGIEYKKYFDFKLEFNGNIHNINGFVGILGGDSSGYTKAGFSLFRRDRVIIGGDDQNYKPLEIFRQAQSTISHKLFGEINLDDFPVNQAKDGFVWDTGLESEFIDRLKTEIKDYIKVAELTIKERVKDKYVGEEAGKKTQEEVGKSIENLGELFDDSEKVEEIVHVSDVSDSNDIETDIVNQYEETIKNLPDTVVHIESSRNYKIPVDKVNSEEIDVIWSTGKGDYWFDYSSEEKKAIINIDHPFFKPFSNDEEFKVVLEKFIIAFIVAENLAKNEEKNGYIKASSIRNQMNRILAKLK